MKDNLTQNNPVAADPAEAEEVDAAAELGKFKDVKTLMTAYRALEAEFTRRSQRLKELEANKEQEPPAEAASGQAPSRTAESGAEAAKPTFAELDEGVKQAVIEEYLNGVCRTRGVPFVTGGGAV
ncbi:MAG: hypothetical protein K2L72_04525, partial [Clostridia bacterium]|nr:hypothetical protein [Clostridia bacterium]